MYQRKAYQRLQEWKQSNGRASMLIEGARRVGKSVLAEEFGRREYAKYLLIDFSQAPREVIDLFLHQRHDVDSFFRYLFAFYAFEPVERDTLIIFDEVQFCPQARAFTKQLVADGRYDYLETGSLVSIQRNVKDILIPSEEESLELNPFDFEEFLWALGERPLADLINSNYQDKQPLPDMLHRKAERLFREYMLVGGMPQVIARYVTDNSFMAADEAKRSILRLYRQDIEKYGEIEAKNIAAIFDEIPAQLSRHEKRFRLASLRKGARYQAYQASFFWLADARLINPCFRSTDPNIGLGMNMEQSAVKCYMADTGLLVTHAFSDSRSTKENVYRDILFGKIELNEGMIVENIVAQQLKASGHKLFYFSQSDANSSRMRVEIDFLLAEPYENAAGRYRISPIEVKSGKRYSTSSLDKMRAMYGKRIGTEYVLAPKPLVADAQGNRIQLPLYMSGLL
ncbi:ATP-binding protein [Bifidobacterium goeldii]|uniref:ATP-binding protein n=1 Tax=Bifidobacterium goeldii TaxID=2306975 RepID=UPI0019D2668F|nr:AAA family ATPase [Bifidobacterium goeldii]